LATLRVLIAGGGTGGHIIPALAVARELVARHSAEVLFVGTPRGMESHLVPEAGFDLRLIEVGQLKNVSLRTRLRTLVDLPRSLFACKRLIHEFKPNVVFGVGGYASGPAMAAALWLKISAMAFEPNAMPGLANRLVGKRVQAAAVNFPSAARWFKNCEVTGIPVRPEFFDLEPPSDGPPHLLVFWRFTGRAHLQFCTSHEPRCSAARSARANGVAPERGAPRGTNSGGLCRQRSRPTALAGAGLFGRYAGLLCQGAPGDGPQRRVYSGGTGSRRKAQPTGAFCSSR